MDNVNEPWFEKYEFSVRVSNIIRKAEITEEQAAAMKDEDWLRLPHCGRRSLKEIREVFHEPDKPESAASAYARGWADAMRQAQISLMAVSQAPFIVRKP